MPILLNTRKLLQFNKSHSCIWPIYVFLFFLTKKNCMFLIWGYCFDFLVLFWLSTVFMHLFCHVQKGRIQITLINITNNFHYMKKDCAPLSWWELSHGRGPLPAEALCRSRPRPPWPATEVKQGWGASSLHVMISKPKVWPGMLTMFQNLSKATTKPEHTPRSPLKVLMWTLTLILSSTHWYSAPSGLPLHTEGKKMASVTAVVWISRCRWFVVEEEPTGHPGQNVLLRFLLSPPRGGATLALACFCHWVLDHQFLQPLDALRVGDSLSRLPLPLLHVLRLGPAFASPQETLILGHIVEALDVRERDRHSRRVQGRERVELFGAHIDFGCFVIVRFCFCNGSMLRHWWRAGEARSRCVFAACFRALPLALLHVWKPLPKNTWWRKGWWGKRLRCTPRFL